MKEYFLGFLFGLIIVVFTLLLKEIFSKKEEVAAMYAVIDLDTGRTIGIEVVQLFQDDEGEVRALKAIDGKIYWRLNDDGLFTEDEVKAQRVYKERV